MIRRARWSDGRAERKRWRWEIKREAEGVERERERGSGRMETGSEPLAPRIGPLCHCQYCRGGKDYLVTDGPFAYPFDLCCVHPCEWIRTDAATIDRPIHPPAERERERERYPFPPRNTLPLTNLPLHQPPTCIVLFRD